VKTEREPRTVTHAFRVVVAPAAGRLRLLPPVEFRGGHEWVEAGQPIARVDRGATSVEILAPTSGRVAAVLGLDGEPVVEGQAVVAIEPHEGE